MTWLVLRSVAALALLRTACEVDEEVEFVVLPDRQDPLNATSVRSRRLFTWMTVGNDCTWLSVAWEMETYSLCFQRLKSHPETAVICCCFGEAVQCQPDLSVGDFNVWYTSVLTRLCVMSWGWMPCSSPTDKTVFVFWGFLKEFPGLLSMLGDLRIWLIFEVTLLHCWDTACRETSENHKSFGGLCNVCVWSLVPSSWSTLGKVQGKSFWSGLLWEDWFSVCHYSCHLRWLQVFWLLLYSLKSILCVAMQIS